MLTSSEYVDSEGDAYALPGRAAGSKPVLFGHRIFDRGIPGGIPIHSPGLFLVQGPTGFGKTTLVLNMIANMYCQGLPAGFKTIYWNVESLMTQEHTQTMLRCILASKVIVYAHHARMTYRDILGDLFDRKETYPTQPEYVQACQGVLDRVSKLLSMDVIPPDPEEAIAPALRKDLMGFTPQFLKSTYRWSANYSMTPAMYNAWLVSGYAMRVMSYVTAGPSEHVDKTERRKRSDDYHNDMELSGKKWLELVERCDGNCQLIIDHSTAFETQANDYEKQKLLKPYLKAILDKYPILIWVVIQDGVTNQRDFERLGYVMGAQGGDALAQEVSLSWRKKRVDRDKNPFWDVLQKPLKSRIGMHPEVAFMIVPGPGAYIGQARLASEVVA